MADTTVAAENAVDQWAKKFWVEYVRDSRFKRYMGMDENSVIQTIMDLATKPGDDITVSLLTRLQGAGVTGDSLLEGNEEALGNFGYKITVDQLRNAVRIGRMEQKKSQIDMLNGARQALKMWAMEQLRDDIIDRMQSPNVDGVTTFAASGEPARDAWDTANGDRILYGDALANRVPGDHSASLLAITAAMTLDAATVSLAKRRAKVADPHIRPIRTSEDEEWFVMFVPSVAFRDLKNDATFTQAVREGWTRGPRNPLFRDGDLVWDGVIIREIPELLTLGGLGAAAAEVGSCHLCGAQALGVAWGEKTHAITDVQDYGNLRGVGVAEIREVAKLMYSSVQHGMYTVYVAAAADA